MTAHPGICQDACIVEARSLGVIFFETRLVVKGIDLTDAALHEQENDPLGARFEVRCCPGSAAGQSRKCQIAKAAAS